MMILPSRKKVVWYALQTRTDEEIDEHGNHTGRFNPVYAAPLSASLMVAPEDEPARLTETGLRESGIRPMISDDIDIPFDKTTILWIDIEPYVDGQLQPHNYVVEEVVKSLNAVGIRARRVIVSR